MPLHVDYIDWGFKDPKKKPSWSDKNGVCFGYSRRFLLRAEAVGKLDSDGPIRHAITSSCIDGPIRHYQWSQKPPDPNHAMACSDGRRSEEPGAV